MYLNSSTSTLCCSPHNLPKYPLLPINIFSLFTTFYLLIWFCLVPLQSLVRAFSIIFGSNHQSLMASGGCAQLDMMLLPLKNLLVTNRSMMYGKSPCVPSPSFPRCLWGKSDICRPMASEHDFYEFMVGMAVFLHLWYFTSLHLILQFLFSFCFFSNKDPLNHKGIII